MASKRAIRRKACGTKRRYLTQSEAVYAIVRLRRRGIVEGMMLTYACRFCGGFHFGHAPAHVRRIMTNHGK